MFGHRAWSAGSVKAAPFALRHCHGSGKAGISIGQALGGIRILAKVGYVHATAVAARHCHVCGGGILVQDNGSGQERQARDPRIHQVRFCCGGEDFANRSLAGGNVGFTMTAVRE